MSDKIPAVTGHNQSGAIVAIRRRTPTVSRSLNTADSADELLRDMKGDW